MRSINYCETIFILSMVFLLIGCEDTLNPEVFSEIPPENVENTEAGITALLNSAYGNAQSQPPQSDRAYIFHPELASGLAWNIGGSIEAQWQPVTDFTWTSGVPFFHEGLWDEHYAAIRDVNIVLQNIENDNFSDEFRNSITGEAKFLRGWSYYVLYQFFGPTPLFTSPGDDPFLSRASEEEMKAFIEQELADAMESLPVDQDQFGKATKGSAMGVLTKFYLNTEQWQKSADMAQQIIDLNKYDLVDSYSNLFSINNEENEEILWALTYKVPDLNHHINALSFPTDYPTPSNNEVFAARTFLFDSFVNSFADEDTRKDLLVTEWTTINGEFVQGLGNDMTLSLKYEWDPEAVGALAGNDIPGIRYADILLAQAEALNEINGPTQEAIDLINEVRDRANLSDLSIGNFNKETLREQILKERHWEFYFEGKSRDDQIRHDVFIQRAIERGKNAQPFHNRFPIPQSEMDANPNLEQNEGY